MYKKEKPKKEKAKKVISTKIVNKKETKKKETKRKEIKKKDNSYFIALLKKRDILFTSWKIDNPKWKKRIVTAESDPATKQCLYIDIFSIENKVSKKMNTIPVHGLENNWHIFLKREYFGKRIVLNLSYYDTKGKSYDILNSPEIDIPLSTEELQSTQVNEGKILVELSGIDLRGAIESENTSW